jgi:hypothetical protein
VVHRQLRNVAQIYSFWSLYQSKLETPIIVDDVDYIEETAKSLFPGRNLNLQTKSDIGTSQYIDAGNLLKRKWKTLELRFAE